MRTFGITGGTGAGKSTVLEVWQSLGAYVCCADCVYHRLLRESGDLLQEIGAAFGGVVENGELNRSALADIVFSDSKKLDILNGITHKHVVAEIRKLLARAGARGESVAVIDALYLLETELCQMCDAVVGVIAPVEKRLKRISQRDGLGADRAWARVHAQQGDDYYLQNCDYVIDNRGTMEQLREKAAELFGSLQSKERYDGTQRKER